MDRGSKMKLAVFYSLALTMIGCSVERTPTAPNPPLTTASPIPIPGASTSVSGFVIDSTGACIEGAIVEVVRGQAQGQQTIQETPCSAWDYGGGFEFKDLLPGLEMTLRASAAGWSTEEQTVVPSSGTRAAVEITLQKTQ